MRIRLCLLALFSFVLIETVHSATQYHIRSYLKGTRNLPRLNKIQVTELLQNEISSTLKQHEFFISNIKLNRLPEQRLQHVEFDVIINGEVTAETGAVLKSMENIHAMGIKQIDNVEPAMAVTTQDSPYCLNGGYQIDNGTCVCPAEYLGDQCENLYCFNNGVSDSYPAQCSCPPGYNDFQCLNRNCRPMIKDDVNPPALTLVVVIPAIVNFQTKRDAIMKNFAQTVANLQAQEQGWIGYYYAIMFATIKEGIQFETIQSANLTDFVNQVSNFPNYDNASKPINDDQGLIAGIELALYYSHNGYPIGNSVILAFSDTANYYDEHTDYTGANYAWELVITWRAKVFFFIIDDVSVGNRTIDVTSAGYENLRYFSKNIHAPLFRFNETEIPQVMNSVVSRLYRPQYTDVRLLTINNPTDVSIKSQSGWLLMYVDGESVDPITSGSYYQIYEVQPTVQSVIFRYHSNSGFLFSVFQWVSSPDYFLWGMHETSNVDMGGVYTVPEMPMNIGVGSVAQNIPYYINYYSLESTNGYYIGGFTDFQERPGCTLAYEFTKLPQCSEGPYVHQLYGETNQGTITRVYPAFCKHALSGTIQEDSFRLQKMALTERSVRDLSKNTQILAAGDCPTEGATAFADPRYQPVRQFIFAVEWADNNYDYLNDLRININNWINSIYNSFDQQMFTLIIFDQGSFYAKTILSEHSKDHFLRRINDLTNQKIDDMLCENFNGTEQFSNSLYAVIMANIQTLLPRAIVHVLTQTPVQAVNPGSGLMLPKSIEVNYFYPTDDVSTYQFNVVTRQTNGRWFNSPYASDMVQNFAEESQSMELIFDEMYMLPDGNGVTVPLTVEAKATIVEILVTGVYSSAVLIHPTTNLTILEEITSDYVYKAVYDVNQIIDNILNMVIHCNYCSLQVRVATSLKLYYGFTSDNAEDVNVQYEPTAWIRSNGTQFNSSYVVGHVSGLLSNEDVVSLTINVDQGSMSNSVFKANKAKTKFVMMKPRTACGYQFVGKVDSGFIRNLKYDGLKFTSFMVTSLGNTYQRIVYYYIPQDLKYIDTCNGSPVNIYGECVCDENWTGEYCQNPVCQNYGVSNFGACNCGPVYAGKFCETVITENFSFPPPTTSTTQTTRTPQATSTTTYVTSATKTTSPTTSGKYHSGTPLKTSATQTPKTTKTVPITTTTQQVTTQTTASHPPPPPCSSPIPEITLQPPTTTAPPPPNTRGVGSPGAIMLLTAFTVLLSYV